MKRTNVVLFLALLVLLVPCFASAAGVPAAAPTPAPGLQPSPAPASHDGGGGVLPVELQRLIAADPQPPTSGPAGAASQPDTADLPFLTPQPSSRSSCTVTTHCSVGLNISCTSASGHCSAGTNSVTCDGVRQDCPVCSASLSCFCSDGHEYFGTCYGRTSCTADSCDGTTLSCAFICPDFQG